MEKMQVGLYRKGEAFPFAQCPMEHLPAVGDEMVFGGQVYVVVDRTWFLDESGSNVHLGVAPA